MDKKPIEITKLTTGSTYVDLWLNNNVVIYLSVNEEHIHLSFSGIEGGIVASPHVNALQPNPDMTLELSNYVEIGFKPREKL